MTCGIMDADTGYYCCLDGGHKCGHRALGIDDEVLHIWPKSKDDAHAKSTGAPLSTIKSFNSYGNPSRRK